MSPDLHPTLTRLDDLARSLAEDPGVLAVLGLGSAGQETDRFDEHSDIDFFVVVDSAATKARYVATTDWLSGFGGTPAYTFRNDPNGRKALMADGLFLEYAVFTEPELSGIPFAGARVVWSRAPLALTSHPGEAAGAFDTVDFHLGEALTNLFVGLHRELRGERLTALRFIQMYAVDHVLALVRLTAPERLSQPDVFEGTRRVERARLDEPLPLDRMCPGYGRSTEAAAAVLGWLEAHHDPDPVIAGAVRALLDGRTTDFRPGPDRRG
ncbi:hypothetical protein H5V45_05925 [Nocardioides sp. KIGAM211]|uniref:Uncharacterized protein n=1 Tax=Nocardioides luti TaxID=2761101 RepID=A0A7X0RH04_9ACTN|nr:hypothetical protein [Nocardioides luti]MBB6626854.1 hypothetical protein [Nocardioides luti]